jgi:hypothetical protein
MKINGYSPAKTEIRTPDPRLARKVRRAPCARHSAEQILLRNRLLRYTPLPFWMSVEAFLSVSHRQTPAFPLGIFP